VTKFRQGFGRLVRRSSDRGVVCVLDSRLTRKRYGSIFLQSVPETRLSLEEYPTMVRDIERFLYE
jgi:ATP-dependent DNA helicase DinG